MMSNQYAAITNQITTLCQSLNINFFFLTLLCLNGNLQLVKISALRGRLSLLGSPNNRTLLNQIDPKQRPEGPHRIEMGNYRGRERYTNIKWNIRGYGAVSFVLPAFVLTIICLIYYLSYCSCYKGACSTSTTRVGLMIDLPKSRKNDCKD